MIFFPFSVKRTVTILSSFSDLFLETYPSFSSALHKLEMFPPAIPTKTPISPIVKSSFLPNSNKVLTFIIVNPYLSEIGANKASVLR